MIGSTYQKAMEVTPMEIFLVIMKCEEGVEFCADTLDKAVAWVANRSHRMDYFVLKMKMNDDGPGETVWTYERKSV